MIKNTVFMVCMVESIAYNKVFVEKIMTYGDCNLLAVSGGFSRRSRSYYGLPKPHLWGSLPVCVRPGFPPPSPKGPKMRFPYSSEFCGIYYYLYMVTQPNLNMVVDYFHIWVTINSAKLGRVRKSHSGPLGGGRGEPRPDTYRKATPQVWFR